MPPRNSGPVTWSLVSKLHRSIKLKYRGFSDDQLGMETLQGVMILAIAAVCLLTVKWFWEPLSLYVSSLIEILLFE